MACSTLREHPVFPKRRIVLIGKTGSGKSTLGNTILGKEAFEVKHLPTSGTDRCRAKTGRVLNRELTVVDTPGVLSTDRRESHLKSEVSRCVVECIPGPHAFLLVLKVEKYMIQDEEVTARMLQYFTTDVLKYTVIAFTHGEDLPQRMTIKTFVAANEKLQDLVTKCGGRCYVFDSRYWQNKDPQDYRSNSFQLRELLNSVEELENRQGFYSNELLQRATALREEAEVLVRRAGRGSDAEGTTDVRYNTFTSVATRWRTEELVGSLKALFGDDPSIEELCRDLEKVAADAQRDNLRCNTL